MQGVRGQHALVTGGGRGIGRAVAAALAGAGARVTVLGRGEAALAEAVAAGDAAGFAVADVTDADAVRRAVEEAGTQRGPVSILVANAGQAASAPFLRTSPEVFQTQFSVNLMGVVHAVQAALPGMRERGEGRIVAVASTAGLKGYPYVSAYCTAKHAVVGARPGAGAGDRAGRRHGERGLPRLHGHGPRGGQPGAHSGEGVFF
jgi:NAD(P)-dependent dehydrogenase (short-subunit alcohol dehydrogenase family)